MQEIRRIPVIGRLMLSYSPSGQVFSMQELCWTLAEGLMRRYGTVQHYLWILAVLCCLIEIEPAFGATPQTFKFSKVDLNLLRQTNRADNELERTGLIFNDPGISAYFEEVGKRLVHDDPLESVMWRFRYCAMLSRILSRSPMAYVRGALYVQHPSPDPFAVLFALCENRRFLPTLQFLKGRPEVWKIKPV